MFNIIETRLNGEIVITHELNVEAADVKRMIYNVQRRAKVSGVVTAEEIVEVVENNFVTQDGYITFANAAQMLQVRYQQVFQRAVVKNKMRWIQTPVNHVLLADVLEWKEKRSAR